MTYLIVTYLIQIWFKFLSKTPKLATVNDPYANKMPVNKSSQPYKSYSSIINSIGIIQYANKNTQSYEHYQCSFNKHNKWRLGQVKIVRKYLNITYLFKKGGKNCDKNDKPVGIHSAFS